MERNKGFMKTGKSNGFRRKEITAAYLFIAPQIIGLLLFVLIPLIFAVVLCFCSWDFMNPPCRNGLRRDIIFCSFWQD